MRNNVQKYALWHEILHMIFPEAPEEKIDEWSFYFTRKYEIDLYQIPIINAEKLSITTETRS
ncbi:hypothetical protein ULO1_03800 [Carboxydocella sp. ULO1]|nr:hypothetical protein ULO1_03800 [Carboxydocella sp. ULO1]